MGEKKRVGIIGCGVMGSALALAVAKSAELFLYNRDRCKAEAIKKGSVVDSLEEMAEVADVLIIAVKPGAVEAVADGVSAFEGLVVSVAGGVSLGKLKVLFPDNEVVCALPNIGVGVGEGVIGFVDDPLFEDRSVVEALFAHAGLLVWLSEEKLHALSALAGSGPGFVSLIMEAFIEAGIAMGLGPDEAKDLTRQTFVGAAKLVEKKHPAQVKWDVAAPGGSTIAGLVAMEGLGVRSGIIEGILATREKINDSH